MPETKLKPCPFCGSADIVEVGGGSCHTCKNCGCDGPLSSLKIANWSTRPESELERLAREVAVAWKLATPPVHVSFGFRTAIRALAAHFAEQDNGKTE